MIYHLTTDPDCLEPETLKGEGFVHCSTAEQLLATAERYFGHLDELFVFELDPARLTAELRYEASRGDELFPHLYGPIEAGAIVRVTRLRRLNGRFIWAEGDHPAEDLLAHGEGDAS